MKTYIDEKLESISKGFLDGSFIFEVTSYSYIEGGYNSMGGDYNPTVNRNRCEETFCEINTDFYEGDGVIVVRLVNVDLEYATFPMRFDSKIYDEKCNIIGEENEDFRLLVVSLVDMTDNPMQSYRIEFRFDKGELVSIGIVYVDMTNTYNISETIFEMYGHIYMGE